MRKNYHILHRQEDTTQIIDNIYKRVFSHKSIKTYKLVDLSLIFNSKAPFSIESEYSEDKIKEAPQNNLHQRIMSSKGRRPNLY